jgi:hypothetical protein
MEWDICWSKIFELPDNTSNACSALEKSARIIGVTKVLRKITVAKDVCAMRIWPGAVHMRGSNCFFVIFEMHNVF